MNRVISLLFISSVSLLAQEKNMHNANGPFTAADVLRALHSTYDLHPYKTVYRDYSASPIKYKNNKYKPATIPVATPVADQCKERERSALPDTTPLVNKHNTEIFSIIGNSMLPTLPPSTSVMVDKDVSFEDIKEGDIIVYKSNYNSHSSKLTPYVIHRVYSKRGDKIICKGDNNSVIDKECITSSNLVGKAITINQSLVND
jgi:hypothetical protein